MEFLETGWREPDDGIWEVRGPRRHFTHSKVMAWVAIDRAIRTVEEYGTEGPVERWREIRQEIHDQVCDQGFNADEGVLHPVLRLGPAGRQPVDDPPGGLPAGHRPHAVPLDDRGHRAGAGRGRLRAPVPDDGHRRGGRAVGTRGSVPGVFVLAGRLPHPARPRTADARRLLDRLLDLRNDLGLLAEEYDPVAGRLVGNFPQAFSHVSLVNSAAKVGGHEKPSADHVFLGLARQALSGTGCDPGGAAT